MTGLRLRLAGRSSGKAPGRVSSTRGPSASLRVANNKGSFPKLRVLLMQHSSLGSIYGPFNYSRRGNSDHGTGLGFFVHRDQLPQRGFGPDLCIGAYT